MNYHHHNYHHHRTPSAIESYLCIRTLVSRTINVGICHVALTAAVFLDSPHARLLIVCESAVLDQRWARKARYFGEAHATKSCLLPKTDGFLVRDRRFRPYTKLQRKATEIS